MVNEVRVTLFYEAEKEYAFFDRRLSLGVNYCLWLKMAAKTWPSEVYFLNEETWSLLAEDEPVTGPFLHVRLLGRVAKKW